jgi:UDP-3-O-[3-hydroxymyristoyl] glucosamine N-acyltransferase
MRSLKHKVLSSVLISKLNLNHERLVDDEIEYVGGLKEMGKGLLTFSTNNLTDDINQLGIIFVPIESAASSSSICVTCPRLAFIRAVSWLQENVGFNDIQKSFINRGTIFGKNISLGKGVIIGENVKLGNNVVLGDFTVVGNNVTIKSGAVIGEDGFGFERDNSGRPVRFPHLGQVVIDDDAEIGSNVTINKGTLGTTKIGKCVKVDDQVHIAHNVTIGDNTLITAGAVIGGGVIIGSGVWVGLNSTFHQKKIIGNNAIIGMGVNVFSNVSDGLTLGGFPGRVIPN